MLYEYECWAVLFRRISCRIAYDNPRQRNPLITSNIYVCVGHCSRFCPDGCHLAGYSEVANSFPCIHTIKAYDGHTVLEDLAAGLYKFDIVNNQAVCMVFQVSFVVVVVVVFVSLFCSVLCLIVGPFSASTSHQKFNEFM